MKIRPTKEQRDKVLLAAGRIEQPVTLVNLAADGARIDLSDEERDRMLAKCVAGEYVELAVEAIAYEHMPGEPNRRHVRLRDGAVLSAAKTAIGRPFLRNHDQEDVCARGGTILESRGVRRGDGDYAIVQRFQLTAPWAVDLALRKLLTFLSISFRATGPILCSHCGTEALIECWHLPGDEIGMESGDETDVCEWIYTSAEIVETSAVNVPAVPGAHIEGIRAALSAALGGPPPEGNRMNLAARLAAILSLAATAGETEVLSAVETQGKRVKTLEAELGIANGDLTKLTTERDELRGAKLAADAKAFLDEAVSLGKIAPADSETWSALYALDSAKAVTLMAARKPGTATPVARPRQTPPGDPAPVPAPGALGLSARIDAAIVERGGEPETVRLSAKMFGGGDAKQINKALAAIYGVNYEED